MVSKKISNLKSWCSLIVGGAVMMSCSLTPKIPVVADESIERMVRDEAGRILAVADPRAEFSHYRFQLSAFPRGDLLGLSIGRGRVYISYRLAQLALKNSYHRWMLRQTLAHELPTNLPDMQISAARSLIPRRHKGASPHVISGSLGWCSSKTIPSKKSCKLIFTA